MTHADGEWFKRAEEIATSDIHPLEEADLRFAMGKYCDDVNDFDRAFQNSSAATSYMALGRTTMTGRRARV